MEFVKNDPNLSGIPMGQLPEPKPLQYDGLDVVASAFRQENAVVSVLGAGFNRQRFTPDWEFDAFEAAKNSPYYADYARQLGQATSQEHFDSIVADIEKELRDKQIVASAGWGGTIAAIGAGMLDPTMFIPFAGPAKGAKGVAQAFLLAGAAASIQEGALYLSQRTRPREEAALNIGFGTLLGGLMGSAFKYMSPQEAAKAASGMDLKRGEMTILHAAEDGSIKETRFDTIRETELQKEDGTVEYVEEAIPVQEMVAKTDEDYVDYTPDVQEPEIVAPEVKAPEPATIAEEEVAFPRDLKRRKIPVGPDLNFGGSALVLKLRDNVNAIFTKASGGTADFSEGSYSISLVDDAFNDLPTWSNAEASLGPWKGSDRFKVGSTTLYTQRELKEALDNGDLDKYFRTLLIPVDRAANKNLSASTAIPQANSSADLSRALGGIGKALGESYVEMLMKYFKQGSLTDASGTKSFALMLAQEAQLRGYTIDFAAMRNIAEQVDLIKAGPAGTRQAELNKLLNTLYPMKNSVGESSVGAKAAVNQVEGLKRAGITRGRAQMTIDAVNRIPANSGIARKAKGALAYTTKRVLDPVGTLARLNPVTRLFENKFSASARTWMAQLHTAGVRLKTTQGGPIADAGTVADRARVLQRHIVDAIIDLDKAYMRYITGKDVDVSHFRAQVNVLKTNLKMLPPGKMSYAEFGERVFYLGNTAEVDPDPAIMLAVQSQRRYYDTINNLAKQYYEEAAARFGKYDAETNPGGVKELYDELQFGEDSDVQAYIHHMFDHNYLRNNYQSFIEDFGGHIENTLAGEFEDSFAKMDKRRVKLTALRDVLQMEESKINEIYDNVQRERDEVAKMFAPAMEMVKGLRKSLKEANAQKKATFEAQQKSDLYFESEISAAKEAEKSFDEGLKQDVKDAVAAMESNLGPEYLAGMKRLKELDAKLSVMRKVGANMTEAHQAKLDQVERLEELQLDELDNVIRAGEKMKKKLGQLDKLSEREKSNLEGYWKSFVTAVKRETSYQKKLDGLVDDLSAYDKLAETLEKTSVRKEELFKKITEHKATDVEGQAESLQDALSLYLVKKRDLNAKRAVRADKLRQQAEKLDPEKKLEYRKSESERVQGELDDLVDEFTKRWEERGAAELNLAKGKADFKTRAMEDAQEIYNQLVGQPLRVSGLAVLTGKRGAQLQRHLNLPFETKQKYLVRNPEKVLRAHAHHMFPDMEMYRATGSVNGARIINDITNDFNDQQQRALGFTHMYKGEPVDWHKLTPEQLRDAKPLTQADREEISARLADEREAVLNDMAVVIDRLRHQRGIPENPDGFLYRAGRVVQNMVITTKLGTVVPNSLGELMRPVAFAGIKGAWRGWWSPLMRDFSRVKFTAREAYKAGIGLDPYLHNRPQALFDIGENYSSRQSIAERGLEFAANKTGFIALFDYWTQFTKTISTSVAVTEFTDALGMVMGKVPATEKELAFARDLLERNNLGMDSVRRIWAQMEKPGGSTEFKHGVRLPNSEAWDDIEATMAYRTALNKVADDMIISAGPDRPAWMDRNAAFRLVAMLRSYTFTATNRILLAGLQQPDMVLMQSAIVSLAMGALSYYTWAATVGGATFAQANEMDMQKWVYEAVNRSGLLGVLAEGQRVGEQIPGLNDYSVFGGNERTARMADDLVSATLGPAYGTVKKMAQVLQGIHDPTQSTLHAARVSMVPYQNMFLLRQAFDKLEAGLADALNLPERRN